VLYPEPMEGEHAVTQSITTVRVNETQGRSRIVVLTETRTGVRAVKQGLENVSALHSHVLTPYNICTHTATQTAVFCTSDVLSTHTVPSVYVIR
jgi:hypothetical protein